jgi:hypothetical protein
MIHLVSSLIDIAHHGPVIRFFVFKSTEEYPSSTELHAGLEKGSDDIKINTLGKTITLTININPSEHFMAHFCRVWAQFS